MRTVSEFVQNNGAMALKQWTIPKAPDRYTLDDTDRHLALLAKQEDFEVIMLASLGFSREVIARRTGYSLGQITYRLARAKIKISDYRNGHSAIGQLVMERTGRAAAERVTARMRQIIEA